MPEPQAVVEPAQEPVTPVVQEPATPVVPDPAPNPFDVKDPAADEGVPAATDTATPDTGAEPGAGEAAPGDEGAPAGGEGEGEEGDAVDPYLVAHAQRIGMSAELIQDLGQAGTLGATLAFHESVEAQRATGAKPGAATAPADAEPQAFEPFKVELDPEVVDPEVAKTVEGMNKHYATEAERSRAEMAALKTELATLTETATARDNAEFVQWFDGRIEALPEQYTKLFGKGPGADMDRKGPQFKARTTLAGWMDQVRDGPNNLNRDQQLVVALNIMTAEQQKTLARKEVAQGLKARKGQHLARPTQRKGEAAALSPTAKAVQNVKAAMEEAGAGVASDEADQETLLD